MAGATGLEPATSGVTGRRSNQLSYAPARLDRGRDLLPRRSGGVKQLPGLAEHARERFWDHRRHLVGDEGFEPPTPSV